jgi:hypothetical protein
MKQATIFAATFAAAALSMSVTTASSAGGFVVDGVLDGGYGVARSIQTTQTNFGDNNLGQFGFANGSEIDAAFAGYDGNTIYLFLSGNLESNFNKLEIFFDTIAGGQNQLRGDNADVDFNGLNRMSDLKFDVGFEADFYMMVTGGDAGGGDYKMFGNFATLPTSGGGAGTFLGGTDESVYNAGPNSLGIEFTIDNRNVAGQQGGCDAGSGAGTFTGVEIAIPLASIGNPPVDCMKICVFVNGGSHDFVSNQVLGPLVPTTCNLGDPHFVDFSAQAGDQFFGICDLPTPVQSSTWGRVKTMYR